MTVLLIIACCVPPAVKSIVIRMRAERAANPERWQTTPIPPIAMPGPGDLLGFWRPTEQISPEDLKRFRDLEREISESEQRRRSDQDRKDPIDDLERQLRELNQQLRDTEKKLRELDEERKRLPKKC